MFTYRYTEAELADRHFRNVIPPKWEVYYLQLATGRCFGYRRTPKCGGRWVARMRVVTGCYYREQVMGLADDMRPADGVRTLTFEQAKEKAIRWYDTPEFIPIRVEARQLGWRSDLIVCPIGDSYTVAHAMQDYCQLKKDFGARQTFHSSVSRANVYTIPFLGGIRCADLTPRNCRALLLHIEGSVLHRKGGTHLTQVDPNTLEPEARRRRRVTANNTFTDLRSALNLAFGDGKIASNAAWRDVKIFKGVNKARVDILTWAQAKELVQKAAPDIRQLILGALYTGCRLTELFKMRVGDIDPIRAAMLVRPVKCYRGRTIALPDEGYEFFQEIAKGRPSDSPLIRRSQNWPWTTNYVAERFKLLAKQLKLPDSFVFHCLRHTYASLLLRSNTPPIVVARQLGHLNMETTLRTYAHVTDDFMDHEFRSRYKPGFLTAPDLFSQATAIEDELQETAAKVRWHRPMLKLKERSARR